MQLPLGTRLYRAFGKRLFDLVGAAALLLLLAPILTCTTVLIACRLGVPVTFCQRRIGRHGKVFLLHKFRSMTSETDADGALLPDQQRTPAFGRLLRSTSVDELPQLFDVLRGEMSLIGPRPLLVQYRDRYTQREWSRHQVRPGITGWAQVNGRNQLVWEQRLEFDAQYAESYSLAWDLKILALTVGKVLDRSGVAGTRGIVEAEFRPDGLQGNPMGPLPSPSEPPGEVHR